MAGWLALAGWLANLLAGRLSGRLALTGSDWLAWCIACWPWLALAGSDWLAGSLAGLLAGW